MKTASTEREAIVAEVVHFISADPHSDRNVTACGKHFAYPMSGNGWRVRDISCPECDRIICDMAHAKIGYKLKDQDHGRA